MSTVLSPEIFELLESQEMQVAESIEKLIKDNLSSTRESWLVQSLVDYYYLTQSNSVVAILCKVGEPHDKHLLDKLHDGIKSQEHQLNALQLLLRIVCKQPLWVNKIVNMSVLKVVIKSLKAETNIPVLTTGLTIVTILLPSIPTLVGSYLPDIFEVFNRLASFTVKKPPGNTPDIFYLHLQVSVYALFHRLYGMFPYNFLAYLRQYYAKKENAHVFEEVIKSMLERVRVHPLLITGNRDSETSNQRWRSMETHDIVVECNKMSLDPVEGMWEELHCPIFASRYLTDRRVPDLDLCERRALDKTQQVLPLTLPTVLSCTVQDSVRPPQDTFWSPSELIGLSTPPATPGPVISSAEIMFGAQANLTVPATAIATITPMNTPIETPPISEDHDRTMSRTSSRGPTSIKIMDPKRLSAEFSVSQPVPMMTPSSHIMSVPPSPLKAEFTSTPPLGVKTLPVVNAARELQFDHDQSEEKILGHVTKISQSRAEFSRQSGKVMEEVKQVEGELSSQTISPPDSKQGDTIQHDQENLEQKEWQKTLSRSNSVHLFDESLKDTVQGPSYTRSVDTSNAEAVSIDNISQVIRGFERQSSHDDEDSDDEVSELTSTARSHQALTSESVKKFMKSVNRIRFNSLTAAEHEEQQTTKFGSKRSRSCPQLPKIETMMEENENLSRSVSVADQKLSEAEVTFDAVMEKTDNLTNESFSVVSTQTSDSLCDISVTSTGSTVTVNKKLETKVTFSLSNEASCVNTSTAGSSVDTLAGGAELYDTTTSQLIQMMQQLLNFPTAGPCPKCQGHVDTKTSGMEISKPFFSTFSPPELLDLHIKLGRDIHAKELSKLPITSTQDVNWTHFGGVPPADEISILRGQLMLLHNQLMYERHKRDQHAKRNRRLLRKITHTKSLEEQNNAMSEQIRQNEMMIRDLQVSLKLLQEENRKLKREKEDDETNKFVQLRCCLKENEDLKNAKKEFNMLLVRQREEQDLLQKRLNETEFKLLHAELELEKIRDEALNNVKLKDQVLELHKQLLLSGEFRQKCEEKLQKELVSRAHKVEWEQRKAALSHELKVCRQHLSEKTVQLDSCQSVLKEMQDILTAKEQAIVDLKALVEKIKTSHNDELKCVEDKHHAALRVGQSLEAHVLQLYMELEETKARLHKESCKQRSGSTSTSGSQSNFNRQDVTDQHGLCAESGSRRTLSRTISLPAGDVLSQSATPTQRSPGAFPRSSGAQKSPGAERNTDPTVLLEDYELIGSNDSGEDSYNRQTGSETTSLSSRETSMLHQNLLNTESDDNLSTYNRSSNMGDSGFN